MIKNSIVLVPFPFDDFKTIKVRPALCLTSEIDKYNSVIIAFISSKIPEYLSESDLLLKEGSINYIGTGLSMDSVIRLHKLTTIPKRLIKRRLGVINNNVITEINRKLIKLFEIED